MENLFLYQYYFFYVNPYIIKPSSTPYFQFITDSILMNVERMRQDYYFYTERNSKWNLDSTFRIVSNIGRSYPRRWSYNQDGSLISELLPTNYAANFSNFDYGHLYNNQDSGYCDHHYFNRNITPVYYWTCNEGLNYFSEASEINLEIFPNPSAGQLNFNCPFEKGVLKVFNGAGSLLKVVFFHNKQGSMDLRALPAGIYYIRCEAKGELFKGTWIKQ